MSHKRTGRCNCGAVVFEITGPLTGAIYCHCTRCQRRTGTAASANARVDQDAFRVIQGADRLRSWAPAEGAEKFFCGDCGSAMFSKGTNPWIGVRLGVIDGDPGIRPGAHQYTAYAAPWEPLPLDGLPCYAESARSDANPVPGFAEHSMASAQPTAPNRCPQDQRSLDTASRAPEPGARSRGLSH